MDIGEAAWRAGVSTATLRHLEAKGLLDGRHVRRRANGYREYTPEGMERLALVMAGRDARLPLSTIRERIDAWEDGSMDEGERVALFERHIHALEEQIDRLTRARDHLRAKIPAATAENGRAGE